MRGGSWNNTEPTNLRAAFRNGYAPYIRHYNVGFRCVVSAHLS
ncbi:MAG: SUMF1/EgtB/PvdO family nonheme iron enzyme [Anaerolineae bacterium]